MDGDADPGYQNDEDPCGYGCGSTTLLLLPKKTCVKTTTLSTHLYCQAKFRSGSALFWEAGSGSVFESKFWSFGDSKWSSERPRTLKMEALRQRSKNAAFAKLIRLSLILIRIWIRINIRNPDPEGYSNSKECRSIPIRVRNPGCNCARLSPDPGPQPWL